MKKTLISTLVAGALTTLSLGAGAQSCDIIGTATTTTGATAVTSGPINPVNGFPEFVTDTNGLSLQRCLDPLVCFFDPIIASDPFSLQIGSGGEAFYWGADTIVTNAAGTPIVKLVMAAETAFLQAGPSGEPIDGSQLPFLRLRYVIDAPRDGVYTIKHPYGTDVFRVLGATGNRDVFSTVDRGLIAGTAVNGPVGPFLIADPNFSAVPAGFVGDANGLPVLVTGSPCGRNFVEVTAADLNTGLPVDLGVGEYRLTADSFVVQGALYDGRVQTPLVPSRLSFTRTATSAQIDAFGSSTPTAALTITDGPTIPVGTGQLAGPLPLDHEVVGTDGINSISALVAVPTALPPVVALTAADAATDATTLNLRLTDFVDVSQADYDPASQQLTITATSSDAIANPALTVRDLGPMTSSTVVPTTAAPPGRVYVSSAGGGSSSAAVRVITAALAQAPTNLAASNISSRALTLTWTDNSTNETGFRIYTVDGAGVRTLLTTTGANATSFVVTGLQPNVAYTYSLEAVNGVGASTAVSTTATTLPLPIAPAFTSVALGAPGALTVSWGDASADETGFLVERATSAAGPFTTVATAAANSTSLQDVGLGAGLTYFYRVTALRASDASSPTMSAGFTTPTVPTSAGAPTFTNVSATSITVSWTDRSTNEDNFRVYRRAGAGTFTAVSGLLPANTTTFVDSTVVAGTTYTYRVDASNWAGAIGSAVSASVVATTPTTALTAVTVSQANVTAAPTVLTWTDQAGETGYRVRRRTVTISVDGRVTTGAFTTLATTAANVTSFTAPAVAANTIYEYEVVAMRGTTAGPVAPVVRAVPGGINGVAGATQAFVSAAGRVGFDFNRVNQPAVGGYTIQRCTVTATDACAANSAGWTARGTILGRQRASPVTFNETIAASNPRRTYVYRAITTTGPVVTDVTGTPSSTAQILR